MNLLSGWFYIFMFYIGANILYWMGWSTTAFGFYTP